jgi:hypothetical protein
MRLLLERRNGMDAFVGGVLIGVIVGAGGLLLVLYWNAARFLNWAVEDERNW